MEFRVRVINFSNIMWGSSSIQLALMNQALCLTYDFCITWLCITLSCSVLLIPAEIINIIIIILVYANNNYNLNSLQKVVVVVSQ